MAERGAETRAQPGGWILLSADDYAMTDGVSRSIEELARAGRLSAASALVTSRHWPELGRRLASLRGEIAIGLHFNLTLGRPLGSMPTLAPDGQFPGIGDLTQRALGGGIDPDEIAAEATRQIDRFESVAGYAPDYIDGHQHVHALAGIRDGVLMAIAARRLSPQPMIRDPGDSLAGMASRRTAVVKAMTLYWLSRGFGPAARRAGLAVNDSFAGVSDFAPKQTEREFERAAIAAGPVHIVMCHPGYPDAELAALDPVVERRKVEHDALMRRDFFGARLWRPKRGADGPRIDWTTALERAA